MSPIHSSFFIAIHLSPSLACRVRLSACLQLICLPLEQFICLLVWLVVSGSLDVSNSFVSPCSNPFVCQSGWWCRALRMSPIHLSPLKAIPLSPSLAGVRLSGCLPLICFPFLQQFICLPVWLVVFGFPDVSNWLVSLYSDSFVSQSGLWCPALRMSPIHLSPLKAIDASAILTGSVWLCACFQFICLPLQQFICLPVWLVVSSSPDVSNSFVFLYSHSSVSQSGLSCPALGDIGRHFAWQAWHLWHWAGSGDALGSRLPPLSPRPFAWQARHLVTSTFVLRHRPSLCVAGVALMALGWLWWRAWFPFAAVVAAAVCVQVWHLVTSAFVLRGERGAWWHQTSLCVAGVALMALGWLWWRAWGPFAAVVAAAVCVAGVALGDIDLRFAGQAWHLVTSTVTLRGRRGTYGTELALVTRLVPVCRRWHTIFFTHTIFHTQSFTHMFVTHHLPLPHTSSSRTIIPCTITWNIPCTIQTMHMFCIYVFIFFSSGS